MSPFEVVQAIQSPCVAVVGLDLRRTVVVFRSVDDQDVGEMAVMHFPANQILFEKISTFFKIITFDVYTFFVRIL